MKYLGILLALVVGTILLPHSIAQTNSVPLLPPYSPPAPPYTVDDIGNTNNIPVYSWLKATGVDTNGQVILEAPERWMLNGPPIEPKYIIIELQSSTSLTSAVWNTEFTFALNIADSNKFYKLKMENVR